MLDYSNYIDTVLVDNEKQDVLDLAIKHGFIDLAYDIYDDDGYTMITNQLALLRPEQNQKVRAWLAQLIEYGPGRLEVKGGVDGVRYSLPDDKTEAELEILRTIFSTAEPIAATQTWMGFS